jgi:hypothetical protein
MPAAWLFSRVALGHEGISLCRRLGVAPALRGAGLACGAARCCALHKLAKLRGGFGDWEPGGPLVGEGAGVRERNCRKREPRHHRARAEPRGALSPKPRRWSAQAVSVPRSKSGAWSLSSRVPPRLLPAPCGAGSPDRGRCQQQLWQRLGRARGRDVSS